MIQETVKVMIVTREDLSVLGRDTPFEDVKLSHLGVDGRDAETEFDVIIFSEGRRWRALKSRYF